MRVNLGISPALLADQHLIAEYAEVGMIPGHLRKTNFAIPNKINNTMLLRFDHMNFFKDKLLYLEARKEELVKEMEFRGFTVNFPTLEIDSFPTNLLNNWKPTLEQSIFVRQRIIERIAAKPDWYRFHRTNISNQFLQFITNIGDSELFYV